MLPRGQRNKRVKNEGGNNRIYLLKDEKRRMNRGLQLLVAINFVKFITY